MAEYPAHHSFEAAADVIGRRIVAGSGSGAKVRQAAAATERSVGVSERMGGKAGRMTDVVVAGVTEVELGGNVAAFARVTTDAQGRAVTAAGVAGQTVYVVGVVHAEGAVGDIVPMLVSPSQITLPA